MQKNSIIFLSINNNSIKSKKDGSKLGLTDSTLNNSFFGQIFISNTSYSNKKTNIYSNNLTNSTLNTNNSIEEQIIANTSYSNNTTDIQLNKL